MGTNRKERSKRRKLKQIRDKKSNKKIVVITVVVFLVLIAIGISVAIISNNKKNEETSIETLSKYGSSGDEVRQIQTKLKRWGYYSRKYRWNIWK